MTIAALCSVAFTLYSLVVWWAALGPLGRAGYRTLGRQAFHHWYLGFFLQLPLWWAGTDADRVGWKLALLVGALALLGQWWMWDDTVQHVMQTRQVRRGQQPTYESLWHHWYAITLYKWFGSKVDLNG